MNVKTTCAVGTCHQAVRANGYCNRHATQVHRYGRVTVEGRSRQSKDLPPLEVLDELFVYRDGKLLNRIDRNSRAKRGWEAGTRANNRYVTITINGKKWLAHRIIYFMAHRHDPGAMEIDHIDGNRLNNNIENLRLASKRQNGMNRKALTGRASKYKGVCRYRQTNIWTSKINGLHLGYYKTQEDAARAYDKAASEIHGEFAVLNFPSHASKTEHECAVGFSR